VLPALTERWDGSFATGWLARRGVDATTVRRRVEELAAGVPLPERPPDPEPGQPSATSTATTLPTPGQPIIGPIEIPPGCQVAPIP
jgi:hypothetical protein